MNKKTSLSLIFSAILFVSFAITSCNSGGETKETPKDTATMEVAPPVVDTTHKVIDTASTRPTPTGNVPTPTGN